MTLLSRLAVHPAAHHRDTTRHHREFALRAVTPSTCGNLAKAPCVVRCRALVVALLLLRSSSSRPPKVEKCHISNLPPRSYG
jgi:hypothetical protein